MNPTPFFLSKTQLFFFFFWILVTKEIFLNNKNWKWCEMKFEWQFESSVNFLNYYSIFVLFTKCYSTHDNYYLLWAVKYFFKRNLFCIFFFLSKIESTKFSFNRTLRLYRIVNYCLKYCKINHFFNCKFFFFSSIQFWIKKI